MPDSITTERSGRELSAALVSARQTIALLRSQAKTGKVDVDYVEQRLAAVEQLLGELAEERKQTTRYERFAKLYEVTRMIGASLDLQTVLEQVMDAIIQLTGAERGFLMLLDDDGNLKVTVARNLDQQTLESSAFGFSRTITLKVLETGQPIVTTNAQEDPRFSGQASIISQSLRSIMANPLRVRGKVIGVVYVDNRIKTGLFSEEDLDILNTFAGQAAVSIDNAELFSATDKALAARVEELTTLQRMDRHLNATLDTTRIMQITLEWLARACQADSATFALLDEDRRVQRTLSYSLERQRYSDTPAVPLDEARLTQVAVTEEPLWQPQSESGPALYVLPFKRENRVTAVIALSSADDFAFHADARTLAARMVDRAAISLENGQLYDAVRAANYAKTEFVSLVAHELKVPMTSISGYAELIQMMGGLNERQTQFVQTIRNAVYKMKVLVSDLSDISRIETGQLAVDIRAVDVAEAVKSGLETTITEIEQRGHRLTTDVRDDLPPVAADKDRIVQILNNLLSNAYKYTPDGGHITIRAVPVGGKLAISVQDTGIGMSAEQLHKLGTKFWRADNGLNQSGTGLGFAIVRNLIDLMHGELDIQSAPGQGSTFTVTLPLAR